ncbi:amino acid/amide ABC transporter membrane protein 2, HAAT family [Variovorax sp. YR266]|uniref:branched-chain amino acid ABC transporter permease n=1 Tax=Variovorax sp. YR266 TaxID=1884386 RepID=UPI00089D1862|nr:branched-chain amino acid ABC transporter permease [Variovorax sp. YR266]SDY34109.1 amino acid/amide ABC transporter membrane protein 2, HAAT family [Variovorax sp. YR266]
MKSPNTDGLENGRMIGIAVLLLCACSLPIFLTDYRLFQVTMVLVYAIAILGLNLLTGFTGQISLGHGAFFAIGAYTAAILMDHYQVPYWLTIPTAALVCLVAGFLFGLPILRLEGHYLALATFALGVALPQLLKHKSLEAWTGGVQGIVLSKPDPPIESMLGMALSPDRWLYLLTLGIAAFLFAVAWNLLRGRVGRALVAIRDQPTAAGSMGVDIAMFKSLAFAVSALYTGVAGALSATIVAFVAPDSFTIFLSLSLMIGVVIGGLASIPGAIVGALFLQFVPSLAGGISKAAPWAIYGVLLIACMFVMPGGGAAAVRTGIRRLRSWGRSLRTVR